MALKDLSEIEQKIIGRILDQIAALEQPVVVKVYSGDEKPDFAGEFDRAVVESHIGVSDETTIQVIDGDHRASVMLVHGNDEDVVSDASHNPAGSALLEHLLRDTDAPHAEDCTDFTRLVSDQYVSKHLEGAFDNADTLVEEQLKELGLRYLQMITLAKKIIARESAGS